MPAVVENQTTIAVKAVQSRTTVAVAVRTAVVATGKIEAGIPPSVVMQIAGVVEQAAKAY